MCTRANIIIVTDVGTIHQFYHHCDGYLSGVGNEIRRTVVCAIGLIHLAKKMKFSDILVNEILDYSSQYEDEEEFNLNAENSLHGDIEYLYVVKDKKLYYVNEWGLCKKYNTYKEIVEHVCVEKNEIVLLHSVNYPPAKACGLVTDQ